MADEVEEETPQNTQADMEVEQLEPVNETLPDCQRQSSQDSDLWFLHSQSQKLEEKKDIENEVNYSKYTTIKHIPWNCMQVLRNRF